MRKEDVTEIFGTILGETAQAIQFSTENELKGQEETHWFPLSQVLEIHRTDTVGTDSLVVKNWILISKGLA